MTGLVWQVWGPYPLPLWSLSHAQTAVSLGDKTDQTLPQDKQTDSLTETAHFLTVSPAFAILDILDIKKVTARACANSVNTDSVSAYVTEYRLG